MVLKAICWKHLQCSWLAVALPFCGCWLLLAGSAGKRAGSIISFFFAGWHLPCRKNLQWCSAVSCSPWVGAWGSRAGEERHFHSLREREMGMSYCNLPLLPQRGGRHETLWRSTYRPLKCFFQPLALFSFFWFPEHSVPTVLVLSSRCSQHFSLLPLCRALCSSLRRCFPVTFRKKQSSRRGVSSSRTTEKENHLLSLLSSSAAY